MFEIILGQLQFNYNLFYLTTYDIFLEIHVLYLGFWITYIGLLGLFFRITNLFYVLISFELLLLGLNLITISMTILYDNPQGFFIVYLLLVLAAVETALGLSLLVVYYRLRKTLLLDHLNDLQE